MLIKQTPPPEFSSSNGSSSKTGSSQRPIPEMSSKPPASASAAPAAEFASVPAVVPAKTPLGQSHVQETSPVVASSDTITGAEKILKPMTTIPVAPAAKTAKAAPKRGLRRL